MRSAGDSVALLAQQSESVAVDLDRLTRWVLDRAPLALAVSGGVDSVTLALASHRAAPGQVQVFHALSAAVPAAATARVRQLASAEGWDLRLVDAGELRDPRYVANPANRCYFCKQDLYSELSRHTRHPLISGTNADDLADIRPGLGAAKESSVLHPLAKLGIGKARVRSLCAHLGYPGLSSIPAQPCLSSRILTGVQISPRALAFVEATEGALTRSLGGIDLRCRVLVDAVRIELAEDYLATLGQEQREQIRGLAQGIATEWCMPQVEPVQPYRRGSAFVR